MKRRAAVYYIAGFATAVALYFGLWALGVISSARLKDVFGKSDVNIVQNVPSPDAEYVATVYTVMGGGAAGWCGKRVTVNSKQFPFSWDRERERGGYSFNITCSSDVEVLWDDNRHLTVRYSGSDDKFGISVYHKPTNEDEAVKIRYEAK